MALVFGKWRKRIWHFLTNPAIIGIVVVAACAVWRVGFLSLSGDGGVTSDTFWNIGSVYFVGVLGAAAVEKVFNGADFKADSSLRQEIIECVEESEDWLLIVTPYLDWVFRPKSATHSG